MSASRDSAPVADGLARILEPVAQDIQKVEGILEEIVRAPTREIRPMLEHVQEYRGKRLRPAFTVLAGRCFGEIGLPHHQLGAIVELIHTATLVHDDVLDKADRRRGLPTLNEQWGNHAAVLLGDFLFATAFGLSASLENRLASRYLAWIAGIVCQGEMLQVLSSGNLDLDEQTYFDLIEKKTAYLFAASARVGAEYVGAPREAVDGLSDYGMRIGTAFQIIDDCLDLDGDEAKVGKTLGTDARQGKVTLPLIHYLRTAPEESSREVRDWLATAAADERRAEIRDRLVDQGSLAYARDRAKALAGDALASLRSVPVGPYRTVFERLAEYTLARRR
jgi:octaprenyl-diphosphate synthase